MIQIDRVALQYSQRLEQQIKSKIIAAGGKIPFSDYMQQILYTPGFGYYSAGAVKLGAGGDFITAPELGTLFANCMAVQIAEILTRSNSNTILELGPGSGQFAGDVLVALAAQGITIEHYYCLELSADLRQRQQDKIFQHYPQFKHIVQWLDHLPQDMHGVIFANEVMDAMPVTRFNYAYDQLQEYYVTVHNDKFALLLAAPSTELQQTFTHAHIAQYISQPYTSEINLYLPAWINSLNACLTRGAILLCDYGFPRTEYYHPQRNAGTLMCHYKHQAHEDTFVNVGLQDVTAHVDFTMVAEAADACGLEIGGYTNLASFLINCDLSKFIAEPSIQQTQEINTLTSTAEMGELFKCLVLLKGMDGQLCGFKQFDKSHCL